jgi:hypothetical protein
MASVNNFRKVFVFSEARRVAEAYMLKSAYTNDFTVSPEGALSDLTCPYNAELIENAVRT